MAYDARAAENLFRSARFERGAASPRHFPADEGLEVAFAGRSNAGKSSAINALCGQGALARVSKTPGRTQQINFFDLTGRPGATRFVDLPGYGFAKAPVALRKRWQGLVDAYLRGRRSLAGVVLLMDVRRPFTDLDRQLVDWVHAHRVPVHAVLTKCDKLSRSQSHQRLAEARAYAAGLEGETRLQLFSAIRRDGLPELSERIDTWLQPGPGSDQPGPGSDQPGSDEPEVP